MSVGLSISLNCDPLAGLFSWTAASSAAACRVEKFIVEVELRCLIYDDWQEFDFDRYLREGDTKRRSKSVYKKYNNYIIGREGVHQRQQALIRGEEEGVEEEGIVQWD